jgi:fatty-acyl-CoA synthase
MPEVAIGYGMTETSPLSTISSREDSLERRVGTVGRSIPHIEISIRDRGNQLAPFGTPGEFCARGYHIMKGYWDDEAATKRAIDADGWMHSRSGRHDEQGKAHHGPVERHHHPQATFRRELSQAQRRIRPSAKASRRRPSHRYGEEVSGPDQVPSGHEQKRSGTGRLLQERLAAFKVPKFWRFVDVYPMTVTGKIRNIGSVNGD